MTKSSGRCQASDAGQRDALRPDVPSGQKAPSQQSAYRRTDRWLRAAAAVLIALAAGIAYANSFSGVLAFDDLAGIVDNDSIRRWWPLSGPLRPPHEVATVGGRPLLNLSFAINYALGGLDVWGYHAVNLTIHILAALLLFGILRRTFDSPNLTDRLGDASLPLALAIGLLWVVHPLQTESVTYVVQRAESMVGMFYLLTLYCVIRGAASRQPWPWNSLAVLACLAGMATKEVMATAPLIVLLYDRHFLAGSFREALRQRWGLYLGLAATWGLLGYLVLSTGLIHQEPEIGQATGWAYARTQTEIILHYLRLSVWPHPLCLDYAWPPAESWRQVLPALAIVAALLAATVWGLARHSAWGFLGAWFFLILAPTSSFLSLRDLAFEHRMYLPLAAVIAGLVAAGFAPMRRLAPPTGRVLGICIVVLLGTVFGLLTHQRNRDYQSELAIWEDTVAKAPGNSRAHGNLGSVLHRGGNTREASQHYLRAIELNPRYADAHNNLACVLDQQGRTAEAIKHYEIALRINPRYAPAYYNLASTLDQHGRKSEAIGYYEKALELAPRNVAAHYNLACALEQAGRTDTAIDHYEKAIAIDPLHSAAHNNLGIILCRSGKYAEAIEHFREALEIKPQYADAHNNLANVLRLTGQVDQAITHYQEALNLNPQYADAHANLADLLRQKENLAQAVEHYRKALEINPQYADAFNGLGYALHQQGKSAEALSQWSRGLGLQPDNTAVLNLAAWVLATSPDASVRNGEEAVRYAQRAAELTARRDPAALDTLAAAYAEAGRFSEAIQTAQVAQEVATALSNQDLAVRIESRIRLYESKTAYRDRSPSTGPKPGGR